MDITKCMVVGLTQHLKLCDNIKFVGKASFAWSFVSDQESLGFVPKLSLTWMEIRFLKTLIRTFFGLN